MSGLGRDPGRDVLRQLRREVGFCCPVRNCNSPYLTWHHFDPPWRVEHHHRPQGMIALCVEHAAKADRGAFTNDQLRAMKQQGRGSGQTVSGMFDWMRNEILADVGGNFYYKTKVIFQICSIPCIWFDRDSDGYLLLNLNLPTLSDRPRVRMEQNFWTAGADVDQIICPPGGRSIEVRYDDMQRGDRFRLEFRNLASSEEFDSVYPAYSGVRWLANIHFPATLLRISERLSESSIEFGPKFLRVPGGNVFSGGFCEGADVGFELNIDNRDLEQLFK